jgi:carboxyl-terminal processing protease
MLRFIILFLPFILSFNLFAKSPVLTQEDVKETMEVIFKEHACHKCLSAELVERIMNNFLEELDPAKVYLIEPDIASWAKPSKELIDNTLKQINSGDFSVFHQMLDTMKKAINRRIELEKTVKRDDKSQIANPEELKDAPWTKNAEELLVRIQKITSLQLDTAMKISQESKELFLNRVQKRRESKEGEITKLSDKEKKYFVYQTFLKAFCSSLDSHTNYFTPQEAKQFAFQVQQRLFGIGAQLKDNLNGFTITHLVENSPVDKCKKIQMGDLIIAVDHEPVIGLDIEEAVEKIRGEKGTKVVLTILRNDEKDKEKQKFDVEIIRNEIVLEEMRLETAVEPYADGVLAHFKLFSFYQDPKNSSSSDLKKQLEKIQKENNLKGVILDLRQNAGGLLHQAVDVAGLFIQKGIVVSVKDSSGRISHSRNIESNPVFSGPLIILISRASASAAEIVAGSLQDYGRAIIVGDDHSFGKGSFQTFTLDTSKNSISVNPKGEVKVTQGIYYTVSGKTPQLVGVHSDIVVPGILSYIDIGESFSKYPLKNDTIKPNFDDDLEDIPPMHRKKLSMLYHHHLQQKMHLYDPFLQKISTNSQKRLLSNKNYQTFLTSLKNKKYDVESIQPLNQNDLQLIETFHIMKDLIYLMDQQQKQVSSF